MQLGPPKYPSHLALRHLSRHNPCPYSNDYLMLLISRMKVRGLVVVEVHEDRDSEEATDDGQLVSA